MKLVPLLLVVPALAFVSACGSLASGDTGTTSAADFANAPVPEDSAGTAMSAASTAGGTGAGGTAADSVSPDAASPVETQTKAVISTGRITLRTSDIEKARFGLQKLLDEWNGEVANEKSDADKSGHTERQALELRVPSEHFDAAMTAISRLGTLVDRSRSSEDVTTQVIDNKVRVQTQKLSLARIQALLAQARTINQVIAIEAQLSQRQADLDSLEQQQKYLADQTQQATISLYLTVPGAGGGSGDDENGFVSGLKAGWERLGTSTTAVLTALGAALPFAAVLALVGVPLWMARRRRSAPAEV